jgi:DNA-binding NtrC family response regulator
MSIGIVGGTLSPKQRGALADAGVRIVDAKRADVVVHVGPRPPRVPDRPWIWASTRGSISPADAATAILAGAYDCLPLDDQFAHTLARRVRELSVRTEQGAAPPEFVARSAAARRVLTELDLVARTSMPVLLTGETGTGKDLAAKHLHARSGRKGTFVPINCAAIPNDLIEGELFGYAKGAFSGAIADYDGQLRAAAGGTVYLDEVDDTPITLQVKLLRVLEDHVVSRLGENTWRQVDFRVVAASNRDLEELVRKGELGADLYQRLAIVRIELPSLRERLDDLPELAAQLVARFYGEEPNAPHRVTSITPAALEALRRYPWPGNVRELRNALYQALVGKRAGTELLLSDLTPRIVKMDRAPKVASLVDREAIAKLIDAGQMNLRAVRDDLEKTALQLALARADGSATRAARLLGEVGRGTSSDPAGTVRAMRRRFGV